MISLILIALIAQSSVGVIAGPGPVAGWATFALALIGAAYVAYDRVWARGKRETELNSVADRLELEINGLGGRVSKIETWQERFDAGETQRALIMERVTVSQEALLRQIGAAEKSASQCGADTERMSRDLVQRIDRVMERLRKWERRSTLSMYGLETELRSRGILAAQPPAPPALPLPLEDDDE